MRHFPNMFAAAIIAAATAFSTAASAFACGVEWRVPVNHFDGVEEHGYVAYSDKIGEIDFGDGLKMPIIIDFQSDRDSVSPYLGHGWLLCLAEAKIVQTGENSFRMYQPDGWIREFGRAKSSETLLNGQGGWKAQINGQIIDVYADCGWKLSFTKGKIASITTPNNRRIDFIYRDGKVNYLQEGSATRLQLEFDFRGNGVSSLVFNNQQVKIDQDTRPLVKNIAGQNVITKMVNTLSRIALPSSSIKAFQFSTTSRVQPTLEIFTDQKIDHKFIWDPVTYRITSDKDWTYDITPLTANSTGDVAIKRINSRDTELWMHDAVNGVDIQEANSVKIEAIKFTSGPLNGKLRRITVSDKFGTLKRFWLSYNDQGSVVRSVKISRNDGVRIEDCADPRNPLIYISNDKSLAFSFINSSSFPKINLNKLEKLDYITHSSSSFAVIPKNQNP